LHVNGSETNMFSKIIKNDEAVSPIVATLVLIVVAIIGAAAVGLLMGSFSNNVSDQANAGDIAGSASTELIIAGSTSVQPVSELLADAYMNSHSGIKITVQGGGSGVGRTSANIGAADIGSASSATDPIAFPNLVETEIGGSAVAVIIKAPAGSPFDGVTSATKSGLAKLYATADATGKVSYADSDEDGIIEDTDAITSGTGVVLYQRAEESGTEETFAGYLVSGAKTLTTGTGATGNSGMVAAINGASGAALGFIDYGFISSLTSAEEIAVDGVVCEKTGIVATLKGNSGGYPSGLVKHLYYLTLGQPNSLEQSYIDFAMSPAAAEYFAEAGCLSLYEYK